MSTLRLFSILVLFSAFSWNASAEYTPKYQRAHSAIADTFPEKGPRINIWANAEGDLNGDGIEDLGLIVTGWHGSKDVDPRGERLIVVTGNSDESYTVLSISDEFCNVGKFYELRIEQGSLYVQGFTSENSDESESVTLQFRYNQKLKDLELIGREELSHKYDGSSSYEVSVNYLTGKMIHSRRKGNSYKLRKGRLIRKGLYRLQGFNCATYDRNEPSLYIEDFSSKQ